MSESEPQHHHGGGPARPGFNEFTPLFERNQAQLNVSGVVGSDWTRGEEAVVSGIYDNVSVSAGQFHYQTDGFRRNSDLRHDVQNLFIQAALTPQLNVQTEFRRRRSEEGDIALNFDSNSAPNLRSDFDQDSARIGLRFSPSPSSTFVASLIGSQFDGKQVEDTDIVHDHVDGMQGEAQYIFNSDGLNIVAGLGSYNTDNTAKEISDGLQTSTHFDVSQNSGYIYSNILSITDLRLTMGISYDEYSEDTLNVDRYNPKFGFVWNIADNISMRVAAFRTVKPALITSRIIQPAQIAGFSQYFDDVNGTEAWVYGLGLDFCIVYNLCFGVEYSRRDLETPVFTAEGPVTIEQHEAVRRAYLYWALNRECVLSSAVQLDVFDSDTERDLIFSPTQVNTVSVPLTIRYFNQSGIFGGLGVAFVHQHVARAGQDEREGDSNFAEVNAALGYRLPSRRGLVSLEARNMLDAKFHFQDESYRRFGNELTLSQYVPEQLVLLRGTFNF